MSSEWLAAFCRRNGIARLSLFGSVIRVDSSERSDVDILVEFVHGVTVGYFGMMRMQEELSEHTGRPVDLRTPAELSRRFRDRVLREARVQYVHR